MNTNFIFCSISFLALVFLAYTIIYFHNKSLKDLQSKREYEKELVSDMITLYCRKNHKCKNGLCPECTTLKEYALNRIEKCPFMESKTFCSSCKVHCYREDMREKIRIVMRFSGPRMLFYHPITAIHHLLETIKGNKKETKNEY